MTADIFSRQRALVGEDGMNRLHTAHIVLCGLGGVGSYAFEALVRAGIGKITIIDNDIIKPSNLGRQLIATRQTIGEKKTAVAAARALSINEHIKINEQPFFITPQNACSLIDQKCNFIIDAIDNIAAKAAIALHAHNLNIPVISCLSTGNRLTSNGFTITDIYSTTGCPLARRLRRILNKTEVIALPVLYSPQPCIQCRVADLDGKSTVGSISYVPAIAGLMLAEYVINHIINTKGS